MSETKYTRRMITRTVFTIIILYNDHIIMSSSSSSRSTEKKHKSVKACSFVLLQTRYRPLQANQLGGSTDCLQCTNKGGTGVSVFWLQVT